MVDESEYLPVGGRSSSADNTADSLLSQDEKDYMYERQPAKRRYNLALKAILFLVVIVFHAGLLVLIAKWFGLGFSEPSRSAGHAVMEMPHIEPDEHNGQCLLRDTYEVEHDIASTPRDPYKNPDAEFLETDPCGHSAEEARARGCRYGMLYGAWLPESCYDEETEANFKAQANWRFYLQPNRTEELSWDEVAKGEHDYVLVEWAYHQRHCQEMNRRFFTAVSRRGLHTIDSYLSQWKHWDHCAHSALIKKADHELAGLLWRKFPDCGLVRWKN